MIGIGEDPPLPEPGLIPRASIILFKDRWPDDRDLAAAHASVWTPHPCSAIGRYLYRRAWFLDVESTSPWGIIEAAEPCLNGGVARSEKRMRPHMTEREIELFNSLLGRSEQYLEFGCGGSTYCASQCVRGSIVSVDSSSGWLEKVSAACAAAECPVKPKMVHVDIGPTGAWGVPTDTGTRSRWPAYYESVWTVSGAYESDLVLVDGRFRVACFVKTLMNCRPDAVIMMHDFASRSHYHAVNQVAREIARMDDLSIFIPLPGASRRTLHEILEHYRFVYE